MSEGGDRAFYTASTLSYVLDTCLRLLHPFTPFVTEEVWGFLKKGASSKGFKPQDEDKPWEDALIVAAWPKPRPVQDWEEPKIAEFSLVMEIIRAIRNMRAEKKVTPGKKISATFVAGEKAIFFEEQKKVLCALAFLDPNSSVITASLTSKPKDSISIVVAGVELHFPLAGMVDMDVENARVKKEISETRSQIDRLEKLLAGDFAKKAPPQLIEKEQQKLETYRSSLKKLESQQ